MEDGWSFSAFIKAPDGSFRKFDATIAPAIQVAEHQFGCRTYCSLADSPKTIFSVSAEAAHHAAWVFIERLVRFAEATLVDENGKPVTLPEVPEP